MLQQELFAVLEETGFTGSYLIRRYEYKRINDIPFYSITYRAYKPEQGRKQRIIYRGPHEEVNVGGVTAMRGAVVEAVVEISRLDPDSFFILDEKGNVTNVTQTTACCSYVSPSASSTSEDSPVRYHKNCVICGAQLDYLQENLSITCYICKQDFRANAVCSNGHHVCDSCHSSDARRVTFDLCTTAAETDPVALFERISAHPVFPMHGPEYHSLVPAVIITAWRNCGGELPSGAIETAVERGNSVAGGACAFLGACGAAQGAGIALSIILGGTPLNAEVRTKTQELTADIIGRIAASGAARCCRRDCLSALSRFAELSGHYLPQIMTAKRPGPCRQFSENEHCGKSDCPWWPTKHDGSSTT